MIHIKKIISFIRERRPWVAVFSLAILGLVAGGYVYYHSEENHIRQDKYREIATIAELKAGQIDQWRKERLGDALRTARSPLFREAVVRWMRDPADTGLQSALLERLRLEQEAYGYADALLLDTDGRILLSASKRPDPVDVAAKRAIKSGLTSHAPALSDLYRCPHGIVHLDAVAPILNTEGRPVTVVLLHCNAEAFLYPLIQSWPTPSRTAETMLVSRDGDDVLFLNDLRHQPDTALALRRPLTQVDLPAVQAVLGKQGMFQGRDYRNVEVLADLHPVSGSPWFMVAKVDTHEILVEARYRAGVTSLVVFLCILLLVGTIVYAYRTQQEAERRKGKEALHEAERRLHLFIESVKDYAIYLLDAHGRVVSWNAGAERLKGYHSDEIVGQDYAKFFTLEDQQSNKPKHLLTIAKSEGGVKNEGWRVKKDGSPFWADTVITALRNEDGSLYGFAKITRDLTERKQAEEKLNYTLADLERSNRELEQFAYVASHDLQEPLRMVSSYTQLLAQRYEGELDEKAKKYIDYATDGAIRMQRLINDLLAYSRVGTRGKPPESTDSHAVLGEAIRNLAASIEDNHAIITNDDLPTVHADASQLAQVFQNLIANAIKFRSKKHPRIHVAARDQGGEWIFSVKDNGIGIEQQYADRVFVIFQRLHTREEYPGTGIGLALCKRIVERHGGRIWFESKPGKGSTFSFTIPKMGRE